MFWLRMIDYIFNSLFSENCRSQMGNARAGWPAWGDAPCPQKALLRLCTMGNAEVCKAG